MTPPESAVDSVSPAFTSCCAGGPPPVTLASRLRHLVAEAGAPVWGLVAILALLAVTTEQQAAASALFTIDAFINILPFILASVAIAAGLKAAGADNLVASTFSARPATAIVMASLFGALSPFCSCGVVPLVASLLVAGVPIAPVLAVRRPARTVCVRCPHQFHLSGALASLCLYAGKPDGCLCAGHACRQLAWHRQQLGLAAGSHCGRTGLSERLCRHPACAQPDRPRHAGLHRPCIYAGRQCDLDSGSNCDLFTGQNAALCPLSCGWRGRRLSGRADLATCRLTHKVGAGSFGHPHRQDEFYFADGNSVTKLSPIKTSIRASCL
ncbi:MAG: Uncharacterised protein [SAR116 cluster bacterium]|nr:MAG: Uncharacterised protein [SAR116 cluster bacterium]